MVRSGCYGGFWGVFKAAKERLATLFHWGERAATLFPNQLRQAIETLIKDLPCQWSRMCGEINPSEDLSAVNHI